MDRPDDTSKARSGRNRNATDAPRSASLDPDVSAETSSRTPQQQRIEAQRAQLLQAHGVLRCLYEVLLHAECGDAVFCAEAAHVAANLVNNTAEELDSVHFRWANLTALLRAVDAEEGCNRPVDLSISMGRPQWIAGIGIRAMKKHYDFSKSVKNPHLGKPKKRLTIRLDEDTIDYFQGLAEMNGIPYQNLINLYLRDCAQSGRKLK